MKTDYLHGIRDKQEEILNFSQIIKIFQERRFHCPGYYYVVDYAPSLWDCVPVFVTSFVLLLWLDFDPAFLPKFSELSLLLILLFL